MTPVKQTIDHDPKNGKYGDCFRACVASILDLPIEKVPHFLDGNEDPDDNKWALDLNKWLEPMGLYYLDITPSPLMEENGYFGQFKGYCIAIGKSSRGTGHSVVVKAGMPVFDPHRSNSFLTKIKVFGIFIKTFS